MKRLLAAIALFAAACASSTPPAVSPQWDEVPPFVLDALCSRLKMDAIGTTGALTVVRTTQPIATGGSVGYLASRARKGITGPQVSTALAEAGRVIPVTATDRDCTWTMIDAAAARARRDEMVLELSAPLANPAAPGEAGIFARVRLDTQEEWYWITLAPRGNAWGVRYVSAMAK